MSDFSTWFNSIPRLTRYWLTATVAISLGAKIGLLPVSYLYLDSTLVFSKLQVSLPYTFFSSINLFKNLLDMAFCNSSFLLSHIISFSHELLFPIFVLHPTREGSLFSESRRLPLSAHL